MFSCDLGSVLSYCRISFGCCGRFTLAELLSFSLSVMLVLIWVLTGHWLLMDGASLSRLVSACLQRPPPPNSQEISQHHKVIFTIFTVNSSEVEGSLQSSQLQRTLVCKVMI